MVGVLVRVLVLMGVLVRVLVGVLVRVLVDVGVPQLPAMRSPQAVRVPTSCAARSLMTRLQVPVGFSPSKADSGLEGRNEPPGVGGHTEPIWVAASSSRRMLLKLSSLVHTWLIRTTVVPAGDFRLTRRSCIYVWVMFSPVRSTSVIVLLSTIALGTSVLVKLSVQLGVAVGVRVLVRVGVLVTVGGVPVGVVGG